MSSRADMGTVEVGHNLVILWIDFRDWIGFVSGGHLGPHRNPSNKHCHNQGHRYRSRRDQAGQAEPFAKRTQDHRP